MIESRWLPLSGIVFVLLLVVAIVGISGDTPDTDAPAAEIASFYEEEEVRQGLASFVLPASVPFLLLFAASLAWMARAADIAPRDIWRRLLLGGSYILGAVIMAMALVHFALADGGNDVDPAALQALNLLDGSFWVPANAALGVMMLGAGGWLLGRARNYNVLGWAALVLGVGLFIPFVDFIALLVSLIWILVASVLLYRDPPRQAATA